MQNKKKYYTCKVIHTKISSNLIACDSPLRTYLHMAFLMREGNLNKELTNNFGKDCITYAVNTDPSPHSDDHFLQT